MTEAEQMKELTVAAKNNAAHQAQQEAAAKRTREQEIDAAVKAGIHTQYQEEWLPKIKEAASKGQNSTILMLGSIEGLVGDEQEIRQRAKTKYLMELLREKGYKVEVSYPTRTYYDGHAGYQEIDIQVTW